MLDNIGTLKNLMVEFVCETIAQEIAPERDLPGQAATGLLNWESALRRQCVPSLNFGMGGRTYKCCKSWPHNFCLQDVELVHNMNYSFVRQV